MRRPTRSRRRKNAYIVAGILVFLLVFLRPIAGFFVSRIEIGKPALASLPDGVYEGASSVPPVRVRASVKMEGGRIARIDILEHFNGKGKPAEAIIPRVLERQSLDIDVIAGATWSSKAILKALENALEPSAKK